MSGRRLVVGVVGLGVGRQHALAFDRAGCEVRWVCDRDAARAELVARDLGPPCAPAAFDDILSDPAVDVVSIASFDDCHYAQTMAALTAGKHVFVEKPLCRSAEEAAALRRAWEQAGGRLKLASNLVLRAAPLYQWLRKAIAGGELGDVYAFDGDYLYGRLSKIVEGWRGQVDDYSVMLGGGIHLVDLMRWLTGERPTTVTAVGNRICTRDTAFRYHDYVAATFLCDSGLVARITANFGCVHGHQHVVRVFGTRATFVYDDAGARLHSRYDPSPGPVPIDLPALPASKGELVAPFVEAVRLDLDVRSEVEELFDVIRLCAACEESVRRAGRVTVGHS